ncbi:ankyrin repeat domain-containing protein [Leifsonia sp. Leaf336]|uniref:ankyrin repeat domain-containing protein n=1 Tax=Leifsonia sp. Leaf336 TaxID=1736341 RepID=UPI0009E7BF93|nr:ankyrin repeat domain-containing protein [Leifsonia sp. Leaf336]
MPGSLRGNATVLAMLLEAGADPNETSTDGVTALMDAAESGDPECVKLLLEAGADPRPILSESRGEFAGYGAADLARRLGHSESADLLDRASREWRDVRRSIMRRGETPTNEIGG